MWRTDWHIKWRPTNHSESTVEITSPPRCWIRWLWKHWFKGWIALSRSAALEWIILLHAAPWNSIEFYWIQLALKQMIKHSKIVDSVTLAAPIQQTASIHGIDGNSCVRIFHATLWISFRRFHSIDWLYVATDSPLSVLTLECHNSTARGSNRLHKSTSLQGSKPLLFKDLMSDRTCSD